MKDLYLIDCQNDFCSEGGSLANKECIERANNIVELLKNEKFDHIFYTLDTHTENYLETREGRNLPVKHCVENTWGHKLRKDIEDEINRINKTETTVIECRKKTFGFKDFSAYAPYGKNDEIYFCGFCSDICVISNALIVKASCPEAEITFIENCSAGVTPEKHAAAIEVMKSCQINIK